MDNFDIELKEVKECSKEYESKNYLIYRIWNKLTNEHYIGLTTKTLNRRIKQHINNKYNNSHIDSSIQKHGIEQFNYEILKDGITDIEELNKWEIWYIEFYDSYNNGYNLTLGGGGKVGFNHSEETKQKMREAKQNISDETRKKISEANKGKTSWNKGKTSWNKGKTLSENHKRKISDVHMGIKHTEESKQKISEANKDKIVSEETKIKIKESAKKYWEFRRIMCLFLYYLNSNQLSF